MSARLKDIEVEKTLSPFMLKFAERRDVSAALYGEICHALCDVYRAACEDFAKTLSEKADCGQSL